MLKSRVMGCVGRLAGSDIAASQSGRELRLLRRLTVALATGMVVWMMLAWGGYLVWNV